MQQNDSPNQTGQLLTLLESFVNAKKAEENESEYRYVMYVRRSNDSDEKQVRSIPDQILACQEFADKQEMKLAHKIFKESESAKDPDIRPVFREMIEEIKLGKYDGILAWHPDRLARNMKEAGEIIDLVDKKIIKNLKFVSFTFTNDTSGKMLLGIAFVLSKQYSDKLSDDICRGIRGSIEDGKCLSQPKHGYVKDRNQYLRPDPLTFHLVKHAFQMRLKGNTLEAIADFLNKNSYTKEVIVGKGKKSRKKRVTMKMDKKRVSEFLRDPTYAGILLYGDNYRDLSEVFEFIPMIAQEEFLEINKDFKSMEELSKKFKLAKAFHEAGTVKADLMRGMILCEYCKEPFVAGLTKKKNTQYFYFRCDTPKCRSKGKSTRAKEILRYARNFLEENSFANRETYNCYVEQMKEFIKLDAKVMDSSIHSLNRSIGHLTNKIKRTKDFLLDEKDESLKAMFGRDLKNFEQEKETARTQLDELKEKRAKVNSTILNFQEFLELFENLASRIGKITHLQTLDFVMRKIFLNFTVKDKKVTCCVLTKTFEKLYKASKVRYGAPGRN